jgi:hypothetical protein
MSGCTPMRCTPVRCTPVRCTPVRCMPMSEMHAYEMHAYEWMHAYEMHVRNKVYGQCVQRYLYCLSVRLVVCHLCGTGRAIYGHTQVGDHMTLRLLF